MIKPAKLMPGDKVGLISPSNSVVAKAGLFEKAVDRFEEIFEVEVQIAPHAMGRHYYSSGTAQERVDDLHQMIMDPEIKAVVFSTGGNTAIELVDRIDYELIKNNPKIITGISDATTLLNAITAKTKMITFVGLEFLNYAQQPMIYEIDHLKKMWFKGSDVEIEPNPNWKDFDNLPTSYKNWISIRRGKVSGKLVGGNHYSFFQLLHTPYSMGFDDSIVLFETYKYNKRKIHQCLYQMKLHGVFDKINGLIMGYCLGSDSPTEDGNKREMKDLVLEVCDGYDFPVMQIGEFGHNVENAVMPIGARTEMDAEKLTLKITEGVTV